MTPAPEGRFKTENCWVPKGATVAVAGLTLDTGEACRVRLALPRIILVKELTAVTVIVPWVGTLFGAVNKPLDEMLPSKGLTDQVTALSKGTFRTENCWIPEGATVAVAGLTLDPELEGGWDPTVGAPGLVREGPTKMLALADLVGSAMLVAEIVTRVSAFIELGAEYNPPEIDPVPCVIDQATPWLALPPTDAVNCWVCPANR